MCDDDGVGREGGRDAPEIAASPAALSPAAAAWAAEPAAWLAAMATGRSFWFCRIWALMPWRVCAVVTPVGVQKRVCE